MQHSHLRQEESQRENRESRILNNCAKSQPNPDIRYDQYLVRSAWQDFSRKVPPGRRDLLNATTDNVIEGMITMDEESIQNPPIRFAFQDIKPKFSSVRN